MTVILGVLTSMAIPQYMKTIERARMTEAIIILGQLRSAEIRYKAQTGKYTNKLASLDFSATDVSGTPIFDYMDPLTDPLGMVFDIRARRKGQDEGAPSVGTGCATNYIMHMDQTGRISGQDCQLAE